MLKIKLTKPDPDIEQEKDLNKFISKYLNKNSPGTSFLNGEMQCYSDRGRSLEELTYLFWSYNPESKITIKDVILAINNVRSSDKSFRGFDSITRSYKTKLLVRFCPDVQRTVTYKVNVSGSSFDSWPIVKNVITLDKNYDSSRSVGTNGLIYNDVIKYIKKNGNIHGDNID